MRIQLEKRLRNLKRSDLAALVTSFTHDPGKAHNLLREILLAEHEGFNLLDDPAWRANFIATIRVQAMLRFSELDSLSMLGAMNSNPAKQNPMRFKYLSDAVWLTQMTPGRFSIITGNPGDGKTDIAMTLAAIAIRNKRTIVTNITTKNENMRTAPKASDLIKSLVIDSKPKFCILDEMGISWARKQAMTSRNIALEKLARIIRKFKSSLVVIIQERHAVPPLIESFSTMWIHKTSPRRAELEIYNHDCKMDTTIDRIPKATIDYDTADIAPLEMDIDIDSVFSAASKGENAAAQRKAIIEYLDRPQSAPRHNDKQTRKEIAGKLLDRGELSQMKIANVVSLSPATVNKIAKAKVKE